MLIFAHRGASKAAPENTVKAFKLAFEQRADGIEFDTYQHERLFFTIEHLRAEHGNPAIYLTYRGNPLQKWTLGMESAYRP